MHIRHIYAFLSLDHSAVLHFAKQLAVFLACDEQVYRAVVDKHMRSDRDIGNEILAGCIEHLGCAEILRPVMNLYPVPCVDYEPDRRFHGCKPYFRAFGVYKQCYFVRNRPDIVDYTLCPFYRGMG